MKNGGWGPISGDKERERESHADECNIWKANAVFPHLRYVHSQQHGTWEHFNSET